MSDLSNHDAQQNGRLSPRTSSQPSDKQCESPVQTVVLVATDQRGPSNSLSNQGKRSPQGLNVESHNAKAARMEATASQGFGGGIPPKIEEGIEPGESASKAK